MDNETRVLMETVLQGFDEGSASGPGGSWVSTPLDFACLDLWSEMMAILDGAVSPEQGVLNMRAKVEKHQSARQQKT